MRKSIIGVNFYRSIQQKNSKRPFKHLTVNPPVSWSLPIAYSPHFKWWYPVLLVFLSVVTQYERHLDATSVIQSQPPSSWPHQNNYDVLPATCCSGSRKEAYYKKKKHHSNYHDQQKQLEAVSGEGRVTDEEKSEKEGSVSYTVLQIHHSLHRQKQWRQRQHLQQQQNNGWNSRCSRRELLASVADAGAIADIKHSADTHVKSPEKLRTVPSYEGQEIQ